MYDLKFPLNILFEVTYQCNNKCVFCYNEEVLNIEKETPLSLEQFKSIIRKNFFNITFSGGEPFLSDKIYSYAKICRDYNISTSIITNGTYISSQNITYIKDLFDTVQISLHGHNSRLHDKITRVNGSFNKTMKGIKILRDFNVPTNINITLTKKNHNYLKEIITLIKELGIKNFSITRFCNPQTSNNEQLELNQSEFLKAVAFIEYECSSQQIEFLGIFSGVPLCIFENSPNYSIRGCSCGHYWITMTPEGNVKVCPGINEIYGSMDNIEHIWNSGFIRQWRDLKYLNTRCKNCLKKEICKGGCRTAANNKYGLLDALDPLIVNKT